MVDGIKQKPIEGVSMVYTFEKANANAPRSAKDPIFRNDRNRGIYNDGWYANTTPPARAVDIKRTLAADRRLQMGTVQYHEDYSQANDLAAKMPGKLKEMQKLFVQEAAKYNVLPLNNDTFARSLRRVQVRRRAKQSFTYSGINPGINSSNAPNILGRSYSMSAEVDVPQGGGDGMIATMGGRWGGWGLYMLKGKRCSITTC